MSHRYRPASPQVDFPALEARILEHWRDRGIVERGLARNEGGEEWVFYEGPPTANGRPGIHHVVARIFKDIFPRFQVMRGRHVHRKAGWDCHGLPVELEIEKELGLTHKDEIEAYGIERFNERCRESVQRYVADWERLTERIGFWINMEDAYWTMAPGYVESVWWALSQLYSQGLLFEDYKSVPYCPRCETALSDHEMNYTGSYRTVTDPSVYVRFPLEEAGADLLVWTTTPWTLPSNLAAAIHPDVRYATVEVPGGRPVVLAEALAGKVLGEDARVTGVMGAADLIGRAYEPPFSFVEPEKRAWFVIAEDFVTTSDGTGIVHIAPAFGTEDLEAGRRHDLPFVNLVDASGRMTAAAGRFAGMPVREADPQIVADLQERGLLFRSEPYEHNYPHCWRCGTPLLYYAKTSWYVKTTARKEELLAQNAATSWHPGTIKTGRFGDWLANNVDWALSRDRYWGTPLPIWRCTQGHDTCVASRAELGRLAGRDLSALDPHRPWVDEIGFDCPQCGAPARRLAEVIDAWFDSGSMPFAQWGHPHAGSEVFERLFPADFIAEGIDQTRGWFYSLMAVSTLIFGRSSYESVLCLGLMVDEDGRKMSKSLGNVLDPWSILDTKGADALRWYLVTSGSPWGNRRLGPALIDEFTRRYLIRLWNVYSFFVTYANLDGFDPASVQIDPSARPDIDRWILSELADAAAEVTAALDDYDALRAGRRLEAFVDDLSNWYVRRSRPRFWRTGASAAEADAAFLTLHECLVAVARLTAPFTPFIADEIFTNLTGKESVHLDDWPAPDPAARDPALMEGMAAVRRVVALGRAAREKASVKVRQPLSRLLVAGPEEELRALAGRESLVLEELNVKAIETSPNLDSLVTWSARANFAVLGPRFGPKVQAVARALSEVPGDEVRGALSSGGALTLEVDGERISLGPDEVEVREEDREGWVVAREGAFGAALDLNVDPALRAEGLARELIHAVQTARREAGFEIADRIGLYLDAPGAIEPAVEAHRDWIAGEVLATRWLEYDPSPAGFTKVVAIDGEQVTIGVLRPADPQA